MKKILLLVLVVLLCSCEVEQTINLNENGSGNYKLAYKAYDVKLWGEHFFTKEGEEINKTINVASIIDKDSLIRVPNGKEKLNQLNNIIVKAKKEESKKEINFSLLYNFEKLSDLRKLKSNLDEDGGITIFMKALSYETGKKLPKSEEAKEYTDVITNVFTIDEVFEMKLTPKEFTYNITEEGIKKFSKTPTTEKDSLVTKHKQIIHFPYKITGIEGENVVMSSDFKSIERTILPMQLYKNPKIFNLKIKFN